MKIHQDQPCTSYSRLQWRESCVPQRGRGRGIGCAQEGFDGMCVGVSWMQAGESQSSSKRPCQELKSVDPPMCLGSARSTEMVQEALPHIGCMIWGRLLHREVPDDIPKVTQLEVTQSGYSMTLCPYLHTLAACRVYLWALWSLSLIGLVSQNLVPVEP